MIERLTILGPMLVSALVAGPVATPATAQTKPYVEFSWDSRSGATIVHGTSGGAPITTSQYLCGLVRVWGAFLGRGDYVQLGSSDFAGPGGQWYLAGNTSQPHGATARCVRLDNFSAFTGCFGNGNCVRWQDFSTTSPNWQWMWWSDTISTLNGMGGRFDGGGENVGVWPWDDPSSATGVTFYNEASSGTGSPTRVYSRSTWLGTPTFYAGRYAFLVGDWGGSIPELGFPEYMGDVNQQFCYLAQIAGKFRGGGEVVEITRRFDNRTGGDSWVLGGKTGADLGLLAEAECVWY